MKTSFFIAGLCSILALPAWAEKAGHTEAEETTTDSESRDFSTRNQEPIQDSAHAPPAPYTSPRYSIGSFGSGADTSFGLGSGGYSSPTSDITNGKNEESASNLGSISRPDNTSTGTDTSTSGASASDQGSAPF